MKAYILDEPELEFGAGRHIDIRFGLMNYGPVDLNSASRPRQIRVGMVGASTCLEGLSDWLQRCRSDIPARASKQPNLFPRFPGFNLDTAFHAELVMDPQQQRLIPSQVIDRLVALPQPQKVVREAVDLVLAEFEYLADNANVDVFVCALPAVLHEAMDAAASVGGGGDHADSHIEFHDMLKARAQRFRVPVQLIRPHTYDAAARRSQRRVPGKQRTSQDEATRAWNLHTALYYKAKGTPWRMLRDVTQHTVCYVGVSFYKTLDASKVMTSVAQVFNQRGEGVVVRGGAAQLSKDDRQPHLSSEDLRRLVSDALSRYREAHATLPARVVVHKSSTFSRDETDGARQALRSAGIDLADLVSLSTSDARLYRASAYPPLRGTVLNLDATNHVLYTKGSTPFFETYAGMYLPHPVLVRCDDTTQTPRFLAQEILALTKMNWNNTQFDGSQPITLRAARQVSSILKYLDASDRVEPCYGFYM